MMQFIPNKAASDVIAERARQQRVEGWTPEHDDQHASGELCTAAASYVAHASVIARLQAEGMAPDRLEQLSAEARVPQTWPWAKEWWKPGSARRDLVKAAALLLAEIERLDRAAGD